jgi:hypothetical protein
MSDTFGAASRLVVFDIFAPGSHGFTLTGTKDGESATVTAPLEVLTTSAGDPTCRK